MATIEYEEYVKAVIAYTERLCDDIGLLRNMVKILIEEDEKRVTAEQDNRPITPDQTDNRGTGRANDDEGVP